MTQDIFYLMIILFMTGVILGLVTGVMISRPNRPIL